MLKYDVNRLYLSRIFLQTSKTDGLKDICHYFTLRKYKKNIVLHICRKFCFPTDRPTLLSTLIQTHLHCKFNTKQNRLLLFSNCCSCFCIIDAVLVVASAWIWFSCYFYWLGFLVDLKVVLFVAVRSSYWFCCCFVTAVACFLKLFQFATHNLCQILCIKHKYFVKVSQQKLYLAKTQFWQCIILLTLPLK